MIYFQGCTLKRGTKCILHWHVKFDYGMAYVMLGRGESLDDLYIDQNFDPKKIKCNPHAKAVNELLERQFDERMEANRILDAASFVVNYVNIQSKQAHHDDVKIDPVLIKSNVFALGETWSEEGYPENGFDGFAECSDLKPQGQGKGKGLSAYSSVNGNFRKYSCSNSTASAILVATEKLDIIFLYLSKNFDWIELQNTFDDWICGEKPTVVMGDCNWHYGNTHPMKTYFSNRGYSQLMTRATHIRGNIIDHLYICPLVQELSYKVVHQGVYYTDHDIIGIKISF